MLGVIPVAVLLLAVVPVVIVPVVRLHRRVPVAVVAPVAQILLLQVVAVVSQMQKNQLEKVDDLLGRKDPLTKKWIGERTILQVLVYRIILDVLVDLHQEKGKVHDSIVRKSVIFQVRDLLKEEMTMYEAVEAVIMKQHDGVTIEVMIEVKVQWPNDNGV